MTTDNDDRHIWIDGISLLQKIYAMRSWQALGFETWGVIGSKVLQ